MTDETALDEQAKWVRTGALGAYLRIGHVLEQLERQDKTKRGLRPAYVEALNDVRAALEPSTGKPDGKA